MQLVARVLTFSLLLISTFSGTSWATVRRVPAEYATIQAALDALLEADTVLVDTGLYEEALLAPSLAFVLRGNVIPDTGDYARPIIDPSSLWNPTGRTCLKLDSGIVVIEDMTFRNGEPMYPHTGDTIGGIYQHYGELTLRRCVFDSTYQAVLAWQTEVVATECHFRHLSGWGIRTFERVVATDCDFQSNMVLWAQLSGGSHTRVERCRFSGDYQTQMILICSGEDVQVRDCVFGPGRTSAGERFYFDCWNSVFEDNVIEEFSIGQGVFMARVIGPGPLYIRRNTMRDCYTPLQYPERMFWGFDVQQNQPCDSCVVRFDSNTVENCTGFHGAPGLYAYGGPIEARGNRFTGITPAAVKNNADSQFSMRNNLLYGNAVALESDTGIFTDAIWNWWGDSTGPRCLENPGGQGDSIAGNVWFDPWYADTTFFSLDEADPHPPVPEKASLVVYPNPFNATVTLRFDLEQAGTVTVDVFNISGQRLKEVMHGRLEAGVHDVRFDASDLPSGLYFARVDAGSFRKTEKMVLLK